MSMRLSTADLYVIIMLEEKTGDAQNLETWILCWSITCLRLSAGPNALAFPPEAVALTAAVLGAVCLAAPAWNLVQ